MSTKIPPSGSPAGAPSCRGAAPPRRTSSHRPSLPATTIVLHDAAAVALRLGLSLRSVRRLIAAGALPVHRIGRAVRVGEDDLLRFLAARRHA